MVAAGERVGASQSKKQNKKGLVKEIINLLEKETNKIEKVKNKKKTHFFVS